MKKRADNIRQVGLVANLDKASSRALVRKTAALARAAGRAVWAEAQTARFCGLGCARAEGLEALARATDLVLVFGGDGTMLGVARAVAGCRTPILGIKVGGLGFLTHVQSRDLAAALRKTWAGDYTTCAASESAPATPRTSPAKESKSSSMSLQCAARFNVRTRMRWP